MTVTALREHAMRENNKQEVVASLLRDGGAWVSQDDPLLIEQSALNLFNDVDSKLQEVLGDSDSRSDPTLNTLCVSS